MRERFQRKLNELRDDILKMGSMVEDELKLALKAVDKLDINVASQVFEADRAVNAERFAIEEKCFELIVTQQPAARDLRAIVAVMNMIVDLERMGDQAKGIAKVIPHMAQYASGDSLPPELKQMGDIVGDMLNQGMTAYISGNIELAQQVADRDDEVDGLYARVFTQIMERMAEAKKPKKVEVNYEILRTARELERFGDLATNVAERVIYMITGRLHEVNIDQTL
ncbi:MAG: phosphate signaling complex protein PhoU [Chloroflexota bacterium]